MIDHHLARGALAKNGIGHFDSLLGADVSTWLGRLLTGFLDSDVPVEHSNFTTASLSRGVNVWADLRIFAGFPMARTTFVR